MFKTAQKKHFDQLSGARKCKIIFIGGLKDDTKVELWIPFSKNIAYGCTKNLEN